MAGSLPIAISKLNIVSQAAEIEFPVRALEALFEVRTRLGCDPFSAAENALLLDDFITQSQAPVHMIPWLLEVYSELAARKMALVGE